LVHSTITAGFTATTRIATITSIGVAVITSFALIDAVVAATLDLTHAIAAVTGISIAIITRLNAGAHHTITAGSKSAGV